MSTIASCVRSGVMSVNDPPCQRIAAVRLMEQGGSAGCVIVLLLIRSIRPWRDSFREGLLESVLTGLSSGAGSFNIPSPHRQIINSPSSVPPRWPIGTVAALPRALACAVLLTAQSAVVSRTVRFICSYRAHQPPSCPPHDIPHRHAGFRLWCPSQGRTAGRVQIFRPRRWSHYGAGANYTRSTS